MKQLVSHSSLSLCESNTDVSRLSLAGLLLLMAEFFLGGGRMTHLLSRVSGYPQVWLCFFLFGLFSVVLATALASLLTLLLSKVLSPFPLRIYLEAALVSFFYAACFFVGYRLLCVELLGGHWRAFSQYHWGALMDMLFDLLSGKPLTQMGTYFETTLREFLLSRYPFFLTACVYLLWCLNRGTILPQLTIVVMALPTDFLKMDMEDEELEEEEKEARQREKEEDSLEGEEEKKVEEREEEEEEEKASAYSGAFYPGGEKICPGQGKVL